VDERRENYSNLSYENFYDLAQFFLISELNLDFPCADESHLAGHPAKGGLMGMSGRVSPWRAT
jgi:hypothetical protein